MERNMLYWKFVKYQNQIDLLFGKVSSMITNKLKN